MTKSVYLSGPITGMDYGNARFGWRKTFADMLDYGIGILSPMRHEGHLAEMRQPMTVEALQKYETENKHLFSHPVMIVAKDRLDIEQSTVVIVNLLGAEKPSQGTIWEMGYAAALGKQIIVVQEPGDKVHTSPFIVTGNVVVPTLEDAANIVNSLLSEGL
jgi:nucleoside 2-deoxyribosyltransferase